VGGEITQRGIAQAYVLAGGGSTRFGRDKALVEIDGVPMLLRMRALLGEVSQAVTVIAPPLRYAALGVTAVSDRWEGQGPLAGIITALLSTNESGSGAEWNLIVGCDMPFLTREWLSYLAERALLSGAESRDPRGRRRGWNRFVLVGEATPRRNCKRFLMQACAKSPRPCRVWRWKLLTKRTGSDLIAPDDYSGI